MGYDLHITRRHHWFDKEGQGITEEEWSQYVARNPRLKAGEDEYNRLAAMCECASRDPEPWLDWFDGNVSSKNPDEPLIRFMIEVADDLGARVQGDEAEEYRLREDGSLVWVEDGKERTLDQGRGT